jgi:hypothetical protein
MRIATPAAVPAVAQTTETKAPAVTTAAQPAATADVKSAVATAAKPAVGFSKHDGFHGIVEGGCIPGGPHPLPYPQPGPPPLPLPHPMPPIFQGDAKTRATQANQLDQISQGVRSGSITAQEAEGLLKEQTKIADYQKQAMSDGFMSTEERLRLDVMQAGAALNTFQAATNGDRNAFANFDRSAQHQADQISRIADGRRSGNITNSEAGHLLRDQVEIADARGDADSFGEHIALHQKLRAADRDINYHSQRGNQFHFEPLPWPRPQPLPVPKPLPFPLPGPITTLPAPVPGPITTLPAPAPSKPDLHILPFRGPINA